MRRKFYPLIKVFQKQKKNIKEEKRNNKTSGIGQKVKNLQKKKSKI